MRRVGATEWLRTPTHNGDMERAVAISRDTVGSAGIYAAVVTTAPGAATRRHHHGDCETAIYVLSGQASFSSGPTGVENTLDAAAGDFVYIPAGEVHVEQNASTTEELVVIVARNCSDAVTIYVDEE
ncbi:MAG TPA: cupin domain-containing protein [Acidimicrobiales bacterium]|nr:cupin domain-containing protein [Acidimicrobiales bacterium]